MYEAVLRRAVRPDVMDMALKRDAERLDVQIYPENLCGYDTRVMYSEQVNALTDGQSIILTSELIRRVSDDNLLALYVAHEMAHAIQGHTRMKPTMELELEADRIGLGLMSRSGFDMDAAIKAWSDMPHPHMPRFSKTHPSVAVRLENMKAVRETIETRLARGEEIGLMP